MSKTGKRLLAVLVLLLLAALALGAVFFTQRRNFMESELSIGQARDAALQWQPDGAVHLDWPGEKGGDRYYLEVRARNETDGQTLYSTLSSESECLLPASLPREEPLEIRIFARSTWEMLGRREEKLCSDPIILDVCLACPAAEEPAVVCDGENKTAVLTWKGREEDQYRLMFRRNGEEPRLLRELSGTSALLRLGDTGDIPMPQHGDIYAFRLEACREAPGLSYPGTLSEEVSFTREDLLGVDLNLSCTSEDDSSFLLRWDETKGESYLVQRMDREGPWQTVAEIPAGDERAYFTGHLPPFGEFRFRVSALGGQAQASGPSAVTPEEAAVSTNATIMYAAVWGLEEMDIYADPEGTEKIGTLPTDRAACVLGEENGYLLVGTPEGSGYVDADYCMIDLPDYIGGLCEYRITNSVSSIYMVHGYPLENMTETVITGYEAVALPEGGYLAPLLYPTAQKLIEAALALREDGYKLRIYDSFRPHIATRAVYDQALELMDLPVSEEEDAPTYRQIMTGDRYSLWDFLAAGISKHNRGIAVDVELLRIEDGTALKMQTDIHDLSWHASTANNDLNAKMLADYMRDAGFGTLFSEWWHFQDMDVLDRLAPPYRRSGVTPEGWRADDRGWRYRCADGSYLEGETREIDGIGYTFGEDGYLLP